MCCRRKATFLLLQIGQIGLLNEELRRLPPPLGRMPGGLGGGALGRTLPLPPAAAAAAPGGFGGAMLGRCEPLLVTTRVADDVEALEEAKAAAEADAEADVGVDGSDTADDVTLGEEGTDPSAGGSDVIEPGCDVTGLVIEARSRFELDELTMARRFDRPPDSSFVRS